MSFDIRQICRLRGNETLSCSNEKIGHATVLSFWQWAFSDLKANNLRGIFAEWLVATLLDIDTSVRDSWASWDIETTDGVKIEVKSSGYLQSWRQTKPSRIAFSGLRAKTWEPETGYSENSDFNADIYVFCVQIEQNPGRWNALDLDQWRFYILTRCKLEQKGCNSLGLEAVRSLSDELTADEFKIEAKEMIQVILEKRFER